jgi:hypothetical protein
MKIVRSCIYPKDIQCITGRSERYGRRLINQMKEYFGKEPHQFITKQEFSEYSGINQEIVEEYLMKVS